MSTIKSDSEDLTLNAHGSGNDILFQSNGSQVGSLTAEGVMTATSYAGSGASLTGVGVDGITSSANATAITINSAENVAIGTSIPSASSSSSYKQLFVNTGGALVDSGGSGPATMVLNNSYIGSGNDNYATQTQKASRIVLTSGDIRFSTAAQVSADAQQTFTDILYINDNGNVGIGTSSPTSKLHIGGTHAYLHLDGSQYAAVLLDRPNAASGHGNIFYHFCSA